MINLSLEIHILKVNIRSYGASPCNLNTTFSVMKLLSGFVECRKELGLHDLLSPSIHILVSLSLELSHYLFGDSLNEGSLHRGIFAWNIVAHWLEFTLTSLEGTIPDS